MPAFELRLFIKDRYIGRTFGKSLQKIGSDLRVGHLASAESDCYFDAIAVFDELDSVLQLDVEIVRADTRRHTYLLYLDDMLIFTRFFFAF